MEAERALPPLTPRTTARPLPPPTPGPLYLLAPPIGNLEDITLRALRVLRECDVVAAEDTRRTGQLLKHFATSKPLLSYFQFKEAKRSEENIERLRRGEKVALVTAGAGGRFMRCTTARRILIGWAVCGSIR